MFHLKSAFFKLIAIGFTITFTSVVFLNTSCQVQFVTNEKFSLYKLPTVGSIERWQLAFGVTNTSKNASSKEKQFFAKNISQRSKIGSLFAKYWEHIQASANHASPKFYEKEQIKTNKLLETQQVNILFGKVFANSELDVSNFSLEPAYIPKRIHQIWESRKIPLSLKEWITSVVKLHPEWEYWFWTFKDLDYFVKTRFHQYYSLYTSYKWPILKANLVRLLIMYDIGGFYLDLDVEALKPLDVWTRIASTVLVHENYEHTFFSYKKQVTNVMNTVIASAAKQPLFQHLSVQELKRNYKTQKGPLTINGVFYFNYLVQKYIREHNMTKWNHNLTVIHPKYWLPTAAPPILKATEKACKTYSNTGQFAEKTNQNPGNFSVEVLGVMKEMCLKYAANNFVLNVSEEAFLNHHWVKSNGWSYKRKKTNTVDIKDIVGSRYSPVTERLKKHFNSQQ